MRWWDPKSVAKRIAGCLFCSWSTPLYCIMGTEKFRSQKSMFQVILMDVVDSWEWFPWADKLNYSVPGNCLRLHLLSILKRYEKSRSKFFLGGIFFSTLLFSWWWPWILESHRAWDKAGLFSQGAAGAASGSLPDTLGSATRSLCLSHSFDFAFENESEVKERWICTGK